VHYYTRFGIYGRHHTTRKLCEIHSLARFIPTHKKMRSDKLGPYQRTAALHERNHTNKRSVQNDCFLKSCFCKRTQKTSLRRPRIVKSVLKVQFLPDLHHLV
jgi:hypothetical protein